MAQGRGRSKEFMALVALVPIAVISTMLYNAGMGGGLGGVSVHTMNGRNSRGEREMEGLSGGIVDAAGAGMEERQGGRRLQSNSSTSITRPYATQLEITVCLTLDHTSDSAQSTADQFKIAVMAVLGLEDEDLVSVDATVDKCTVDGWERRTSAFITTDETTGLTAADAVSEYVDFINEEEAEFFEGVAASIHDQDGDLDVEGTDFDVESLGFLVIWLDDDGDVISSQTTSTTSKDVINIGGTDVWWPWWAWLIYAGVVVCCICPMLFFFFKWRRDKEAEEEGFGAPAGKDLGTPAPPSATSTNPNPYGAGYSGGEEYKNGT